MLTGFEWIVVVILVVVLLLWGPTKLPELARSIGLAKREFEKASKGLETELTTAPTSKELEEDRKVLELAKSLGIETRGKTKAEILDEISKKLKEKGESG